MIFVVVVVHIAYKGVLRALVRFVFLVGPGGQDEGGILEYCYWKLNISTYHLLVIPASIDCRFLAYFPCCRDQILPKEPEEGVACFGSGAEGTLADWGGRQGSRSARSHCMHNQEAEKAGCYAQPAFSCLISPGPQPRGWCHPRSRWLLLLETSYRYAQKSTSWLTPNST